MSFHTKKRTRSALLDLLALIIEEPNPDWREVRKLVETFVDEVHEHMEDEFLSQPAQQEPGERISAECHFTGEKHANSRRAIGLGEYGQVPMCASCLADYAEARKPVDPSELESHGPVRAAQQEGDDG